MKQPNSAAFSATIGSAPLVGTPILKQRFQIFMRFYFSLFQITVDNTADIQCISNGCALLIEDEKVLSYVKNEVVKSSYRRLMTNSYVESNKLLRWCPGTDCGKAVKVQRVPFQFSNKKILGSSSRMPPRCMYLWHEILLCLCS